MYTLEDVLLAPDAELRQNVVNNKPPHFSPHPESMALDVAFIEPVLFLLEPDNEEHVRQGLWQLTRYLYLGIDGRGNRLHDSRSDLSEWLVQDLPYAVDKIDKKHLLKHMRSEFANPITSPDKGFPVGLLFV